MLSRNVEHAVRGHPSGWLLESSADLLRGDVVVGNLESPFTTRRRPEQVRPGPYRLPADPALVSSLAPFTALSLANNHALDAGPEGLAEALWFTDIAYVRDFLLDPELADTMRYIDQLEQAGQFVGLKRLSVEYLSFDMQDATHATVTTRERFSGELRQG